MRLSLCFHDARICILRDLGWCVVACSEATCDFRCEFLLMRDLDVDKHWFVTFYHLERGPRPISRIDLSAVPVAEASGPHPFWPPSVIRRPRGSDGSGGSGGPHMSATGPVVADAGDGSAPSIGASSASSGPSSTGAGPLVPGVSDAVFAGFDKFVLVDEGLADDPSEEIVHPEPEDLEELFERAVLARTFEDESDLLPGGIGGGFGGVDPGWDPLDVVAPPFSSPYFFCPTVAVVDPPFGSGGVGTGASSSSSSGLSGSPPVPPPPAPYVPARRVPYGALAIVAVQGGAITCNETQQRFVATCLNPAHGRCVMQRNKRTASCSGRPIGFLVAWLAHNSCGRKVEHWDELHTMLPQDVRLHFRNEFKQIGGEMVRLILSQEADVEGDSEEPLLAS
jgi:hypothetical protein